MFLFKWTGSRHILKSPLLFCTIIISEIQSVGCKVFDRIPLFTNSPSFFSRFSCIANGFFRASFTVGVEFSFKTVLHSYPTFPSPVKTSSYISSIIFIVDFPLSSFFILSVFGIIISFYSKHVYNPKIGYVFSATTINSMIHLQLSITHSS